MLYYSLNHRSPKVNFKDATINGQAPDGGLYFPEQIPLLPKGFLNNFEQRTKEEIALTVLQPYIGNTIPEHELQNIISKTFHFPFPLQKIKDAIFSLELFHGPTLAFKDVGARFMSLCLHYFLKEINKPVTVLVATSGDTGGAVAQAFYGLEGIRVVILYPAGKVSSVQELQLTTLGKNVTALQVQGNFDDCQQMVKKAFGDENLQNKMFLTSANSINIARWLPQQLYYFFAMQQWPYKNEAPVISVPSGNFGNIAAVVLAHQSGLPVQHFIAACNQNKVVPQFFNSGTYQPQPAIATLSNAMDVGNPSNFARVMQLFGNQFPAIKEKMSSVSISDGETKATMQKVFQTFGYITDPHGAVAYAALENYLHTHANRKGYFLETAHPVKFADIVESAIDTKLEMPQAVTQLINKEKVFISIPNNYDALSSFLLENKL